MLNNTSSLAFSFGWPEWTIVILALLLLFGGKKLPELARGLARGMRTFKDELGGVKRELESDDAAGKQTKPTQQAEEDKTKV